MNKKKTGFIQWLVSEKGVWLLLILLTFSGVLDHDLWEPHEYREAGVAFDMAKGKNFLVPHLAGKPFVEKPPLFYALLALSYIVTGWNAARLFRFISALISLGTLFLTYRIGQSLFPEERKEGAIVSTVILATGIGFMRLSHFIIVDTLLAFFVVLSYWSFLKILDARKERYLIVFYAAMTGAFLTKGFIGPVFVLGGLFLYILLSRRFYLIGLLLYPKGILLSVFLIASWLVPFYLWDKGGVFKIWFWDQHFGRFTGTAYGHKQAAGEALTQLAINLLPWTLALIPGVFRLFKKENRERLGSFSFQSLWLIIFSWGIWSMFFLSISKSFRSVYLLPVYPAFALIAGGLFTLSIKKNMTEKIGIFFLYILMIALSGIFLLSWFFILPSNQLYLFFCLLGMVMLTLFYRIKEHYFRENRKMKLSLYTLTLIFFIFLFNLACPLLEHFKSVCSSVIRINDYVPQGKICSGWELSESFQGIIPIYTGRSIYNVEEPSFYHPESLPLFPSEIATYLKTRTDACVLEYEWLEENRDIIFSVFTPEVLEEYLKYSDDVYLVVSSDYHGRIRPHLRIFGASLNSAMKKRNSRFTMKAAQKTFPLELAYSFDKESLSLCDPETWHCFSDYLIDIARIPLYPNRNEKDLEYIAIVRVVKTVGRRP